MLLLDALTVDKFANRMTSCTFLALGLLHIIIREGLYDKGFVEKWTVGFNRLKAHVAGYTPEESCSHGRVF